MVAHDITSPFSHSDMLSFLSLLITILFIFLFLHILLFFYFLTVFSCDFPLVHFLIFLLVLLFLFVSYLMDVCADYLLILYFSL